MQTTRSLPLRRLLVLLVLVLVVSVAFFFGTRNPPPPLSPADRASAIAVEKSHAPPAAAALAPPGLDWTIADGGRDQHFVLSMDEIVIRDAQGEDHPRTIVPAATPSSYPARLAAMAGEGTALPVLYPARGEHDPGTRRLVTSSVLAEAAEGVDRTSLAATLGMPVEMLPPSSPHHVVLAAASPLAALEGLATWRAAPGVASVDVLLARRQSKKSLPNDPLFGTQWHLKNQGQANVVAGTDVNIDSVWNYPSTTNAWRGKGIRIGIVDDGLQLTHPDLMANVDTVNDHDWNGNDSDPSPGSADLHGTCCAGNAGAVGNNGIGVTGTAPECTLVGLRLIAAAETDAQEADAFGWLNTIIPIKSNSWGPTDNGKTLEGPGTLATAALADATTNGRGGLGTIFTWAGGNGGDVGDNSNYDGYANSIHVIAVGALDSLSRQAYYSEPGANLICVAPSDGDTPALGIVTTDRTARIGYNKATTAKGGDYTTTAAASSFGGTSSATPTTAGILALVLQRNPNLGWRDFREILIRSSKRVNPTDASWASNGAGFRFSHKFGAGLIDAAAAVNLAATWTNLPAVTSAVSTQSGLNVAIPDNTPAGITRTFDLSASHLRCEHVTVKVNITHHYRGDLAITLTSPSGTVSTLAEKHSDSGDNYANWTFSSVHHWGESSTGTWILNIADLGAGDIGTLTSAELTVRGTTPASDYAAWAASFPSLTDTSATADPDHDGLPNLVEYHLGLNPTTRNAGILTTTRSATAMTFTYRQAKGVASTAFVEWSDTLAAGSWSTTGVTRTIAEDNSNDQLIVATVPINSTIKKRFMRLHVTL